MLAIGGICEAHRRGVSAESVVRAKLPKRTGEASSPSPLCALKKREAPPSRYNPRHLTLNFQGGTLRAPSGFSMVFPPELAHRHIVETGPMTLTVGSIFGGRSQTRQERSQEQHSRPVSYFQLRFTSYRGHILPSGKLEGERGAQRIRRDCIFRGKSCRVPSSRKTIGKQQLPISSLHTLLN